MSDDAGRNASMLADKVVIVTGGAGLLGAGFCRAIAEQDGIVIVADLDYTAAARVASEIDSIHRGRAYAATIDIRDRASIVALLEQVHTRQGSVAAVVNNAYPRNGSYGRKLEDVTYADFCENLSMHVGGYFLVAQQAALFFRQQGGGNILNMASIYGIMPPRFEIYAGTPMTMPVEYAAIKSAVVHLTRYMAQYFKADGIRVNCLSPGGIRDRQAESFLQAYDAHCGKKGMLDPADLTGALVFLLSDASKYLTGQNLVVDDGFSL